MEMRGDGRNAAPIDFNAGLADIGRFARLSGGWYNKLCKANLFYKIKNSCTKGLFTS